MTDDKVTEPDARWHQIGSGKPIGRPRTIFRRDSVRELRDQQKLSWRRIAQELGSTIGTVRRVYREANDDSGPCQKPAESAS